MIYDDLMLFFWGYEKCCENFASKNSKPKKEKKEKKGGLFITQQLLNQIAQLGASGTKSFSLEPKLPIRTLPHVVFI